MSSVGAEPRRSGRLKRREDEEDVLVPTPRAAKRRDAPIPTQATSPSVSRASKRSRVSTLSSSPGYGSAAASAADDSKMDHVSTLVATDPMQALEGALASSQVPQWVREAVRAIIAADATDGGSLNHVHPPDEKTIYDDTNYETRMRWVETLSSATVSDAFRLARPTLWSKLQRLLLQVATPPAAMEGVFEPYLRDILAGWRVPLHSRAPFIDNGRQHLDMVSVTSLSFAFPPNRNGLMQPSLFAYIDLFLYRKLALTSSNFSLFERSSAQRCL